jgi:hypothetical protein
MKKTIILALIVGLFIIIFGATSSPLYNNRTTWNKLGTQTLTLNASGVSTLTLPSWGTVWEVDVFVDGGPVRCLWNNLIPTTSTGYKLNDQAFMTLQCADEWNNFQAILDSSASSGGKLIVIYLGQ